MKTSDINPITGKPFGTYSMEEMFEKGWRNSPIDRQAKHLMSPLFTEEERTAILNSLSKERREAILNWFNLLPESK
jgi:hypothetical protein